MRFLKVIGDTGKSRIVVDPENAILKERNFDIRKLLEFPIETYNVLKASADEFSWNVVFGLPHKFLDTWTNEEQGEFCELLAAMKYKIMVSLNNEGEIIPQNLINLETELSQMLAAFGRKVKLFDRLVRFVEKEVPIQSFSGVGERAQDTEAMTFYRDDVVKLTADAILCKMLTPILGTFIEACKKRMDNGYKEIHAYAILKDILNESCRPLIDKIEFFIDRIVQPMLNRLQLTHTYYGYTNNVIRLQINAYMQTRRLVTVDLLKKDGNLVTYITSCARAAAQTQFSSSVNFKHAVKELFRKEDDTMGREEGNVSTLEEESRYSARTADYPIMIKKATLTYLDIFIDLGELDRTLISQVEAYYQQFHINTTPLNEFLMGLIFGPGIGGAKGIEILDLSIVTKLISTLQVYLLQQGFFSLINGCSALLFDQLKMEKTGTDILIASSWMNNTAYRNCDQRYPFMINDLRWDTVLKQIITSLTEKVYTYNTAPVIYDIMGTENYNGKEYHAPEELPKDLCVLILDRIQLIA